MPSVAFPVPSLSRPLRLVFMGTPEFAVPALQALLESEDTVVGVVCQPDKPAGRRLDLHAPPVKGCARAPRRAGLAAAKYSHPRGAGTSQRLAA